MAELVENFNIPLEPLKTDRWYIRIGDINPMVFSKFDLTTKFIDGKFVTIFKTEIRNFITKLQHPDQLVNAENVRIELLDPTNLVVDHYEMVVKLKKIKLVGDYSKSGILTHKVSFYVKSIKTTDSDTQLRESEKKALEGYLSSQAGNENNKAQEENK
jgi:hypothetical protein